MGGASERQPLDEANLDFIASGVSIFVASRDISNVPTLVRALGCRIAPDRQRISVFVASFQCLALLQDVRATRVIAAVFSQPSTHRTIQLKGTDAAVEQLENGDADIMQLQARAFAADLALLGYPPILAQTMLAYAPNEVVAITFTATAAFVQTPGPRAGAPLQR